LAARRESEIVDSAGISPVDSVLTVLNVAGARPNFMKVAPLMRCLARRPDVRQILVHTGQHYDDNLSAVFFEELGIAAPDINLGIGSGERDEQIARISEAFRPVLHRVRPDVVLVVGDVNSTIACARVAREHGVKVGHVEAGLRSFDLGMPEEHNRRETDEIADFLFVTEPSGMENLEHEGVGGKAFLVGNVMIDTLVAHLRKAEQSDALERFRLAPGKYLVATFHRPSNVDRRDRLLTLLDAISGLCRRAPLVLPLHPRTRGALSEHGLVEQLESCEGLILCAPLGYLDFLKLVSRAAAVITDSGGIQEETTYLRIPCITMRGNTERPITTSVGSNVLVGNDIERLFRELDAVLRDPEREYGIPELWDGHAAERIVELLLSELSPA
jgi:UDP-N-acetylglucosamine 2-epimerase (non-hydrolysing)